MPTVTQLIARVGIDVGDIAAQLLGVRTAMVDGVGRAAQDTQNSINSLTSRIEFQKRQLDILGQALQETIAAHGATSIAAQRQQLAYDRLLASIAQNEQRLPQLQERLADLNSETEAGASFADQLGESLVGSLADVLGPAALASAAIGSFGAILQSFKSSLDWKNELDQTNQAIEIQLRGVRDAGQVFDEAADFATRYKLTQQETSEILQNSIDIMRVSTSGVSDLEATLLRLQQRDPSKSISEAARALRELASGDVASIKELFNVSADDAHRMKEAIEAGQDPVKVIASYLDRMGVSMDLLEQRTKGYEGALNNAAIAQERLQIAQARLAEGPGANIVAVQAEGYNELSRILGDGQGLGAAFRNIAALTAGNAGAIAAFNVALAKTGDIQRAVAAAGRIRNAIYEQATGQDLAGASATEQRSKATQNLTVATRELSEEERKRLEGQRDTASERAAGAFDKIRDAEQAYQRESHQRLTEHQRKLADITREGQQRLTELEARYQDQRAATDAAYVERRATIAEALAKRLAELETQHRDTEAAARAAAVAKLADIDQSLADRLSDLARDSARRIAEIQAEADQQRADDAEQRATARAEREQDIARGLAERLADFDAQQAERRSSAAERLTEQLAAIAERRAERERDAQQTAIDRARDYHERLADLERDAQDRAQDRAQAHADRIQALRDRLEARAAAQTTIRTQTLTGETTFKTFSEREGTDNRADIEKQIAAEEEKFRRDEARAARDEQVKRERAERDRARQEEDAARKLEMARAADERAAAQAEAAAAAAEAKAQAQADKQRARIEQQAAQQIEALARQYQQQEQAAAEQAAKEDARRAQQIQKERDALAQKEADAREAADRQRQRLSDDYAQDAARREEDYQRQRDRATQAAADQLADADAAYIKQTGQQAAQYAQQREQAQQAIQERIAQEADRYAREDEQRAAAYARQKQQLEEALGEQLKAYTEAQVKLGDITQEEGDRRLKIVNDLYLKQVKAQRDAYDAYLKDLFAGGGTTGSRPSTDTLPALSGSRPSADTLPPAGGRSSGSFTFGDIVLPGVTSPEQFGPALRDWIIRQVRAAGGDVLAFFGGF